MPTMSLDFSKKPDLSSLAVEVRDLHAIAQPMPVDYFWMGAAARDLMLYHGCWRDVYRV